MKKIQIYFDYSKLFFAHELNDGEKAAIRNYCETKKVIVSFEPGKVDLKLTGEEIDIVCCLLFVGFTFGKNHK